MSHLPTLTSNPNLYHKFNQNYGGLSPPGRGLTSDGILTVPVEPQTQMEFSVRMINSEFATLGYPGVLFNEKDQSKINVNSLIQNTLKILESHFRELSVRAESESRVHSLEADLAHLHKVHRRSQDELNEAHRSIAAAKERDRRSEEEKKSINRRLKITTDELRKMQLAFNRYEVQSAHERRKLEREVVCLRERLSATLYKTTNSANSSRFASRSSGLASMAKLSTSLLSLSSTSQDGASKPAIASNARSPHTKSRLATRFNARCTSTCSSSVTNGRISSSGAIVQPTGNDSMSVSTPEASSQVDMYLTVIRQLEERQHSLLYENRELRDLVGQISSRLVRCSRFIDRHSSPDSTCQPDTATCEDFDSMNEDDDDDIIPLRPDSSDDEMCHDDGNSTHRRKSSEVNDLLLQLPYALVRDHLTQRVRRLSRDLWRRIKKWINAGSMNPVTDKTNVQMSSQIATVPSENTDLPADEHSDMQKEVVELRKLVAEYETKLAEQQVALRRALFSSSRRLYGCSRTNLATPDGGLEQSGSSAPTRSFESSPQHRISLFKVNQLPFTLTHKNDTSKTSNGVVVPTDGAGDRVCEIAAEDDNDVINLNENVSASHILDDEVFTDRKVFGTIIIERKSRRNLSNVCSDTSGVRQVKPSHITFTGSPFPTRARPSSFDQNL